MGFELKGEAGTEVQLRGASFWEFYLRLAQNYGWTPAGTLPPAGLTQRPWPGRYDTNDGQTVSREDASEFGLALERALRDLGMRRRGDEVARRLASELAHAFRRATGEELPDELADTVGSDDDTLRALVQLARSGAFKIA